MLNNELNHIRPSFLSLSLLLFLKQSYTRLCSDQLMYMSNFPLWNLCMKFRILMFHTFSSFWVCCACTLCYATFFRLYFLFLPYLQVWLCFLLLVWCLYLVPAFLSYMSNLVACITSYMFHIPSIAINNFVTEHIARKTISIKMPRMWWYFCVMILNHCSSTSSCNMSKIMTLITFNIIHLSKWLNITSIVRSKRFSLKNLFP